MPGKVKLRNSLVSSDCEAVFRRQAFGGRGKSLRSLTRMPYTHSVPTLTHARTSVLNFMLSSRVPRRFWGFGIVH
jgi:hypothetical protein